VYFADVRKRRFKKKYAKSATFGNPIIDYFPNGKILGLV